MQNDILVLGHANCLDGQGALYAAWKYFGDTADYFPIQYDKRTHFEIRSHYTKVYILDFSFTKEYLLHAVRMRPELQIILIDHHKTAWTDLSDLKHPQIEIRLNMERSGATLTWMHFFPDKPIPELLLAIEDRDLWKFKYPDSKKITAGLYPYKRDFNVWDKLDTATLKEEGTCILRYQESLIKYISKQAFRYPTFAVVQTPVLASEVCNHLLETLSDIAFSVAVCDRNALDTQVSLRSVDFDVESLAKKFGGGGHKSAAGFVVPRLSIDTLAKQIQEHLT